MSIAEVSPHQTAHNKEAETHQTERSILKQDADAQARPEDSITLMRQILTGKTEHEKQACLHIADQL